MIAKLIQWRWPLFVVAILLTTVAANVVLLVCALDDPHGGARLVEDYNDDSATDRKARTLLPLNGGSASTPTAVPTPANGAGKI